jgi:rhamnose utilization protein RhaD (predicted bifunctional aldolase and dehydrogenase)
MHSRWSDADAARFVATHAPRRGEALALCAYASRLLGADAGIVLHGGGNTSVKDTWRTVLGDAKPALFVKASGLDLARIEPDGFAPLDLASLQRLAALDALDDESMVNELRTHLFDHRSPTPSIEALVHAFLPARYVFHTHADAILALTNQQDAAAHLGDAIGGDLAVVEYVEPGFGLARAAADAALTSPGAVGLVLMRHGLLTWGETAREAYEATIRVVGLAERYAGSRARPGRSINAPPQVVSTAWNRLAAFGPIIRGQLASPSGNPDLPWNRVVVRPLVGEETLSFLASDGARDAAVTPPLTADHLIRTKSLPLWLDAPDFDHPERFRETLRAAVQDYAVRYEAYVARHRSPIGGPLPGTDPLPRVLLIPGLGALCAGADARAAEIARDITAATLRVKRTIRDMGTYVGLS